MKLLFSILLISIPLFLSLKSVPLSIGQQIKKLFSPSKKAIITVEEANEFIDEFMLKINESDRDSLIGMFYDYAKFRECPDVLKKEQAVDRLLNNFGAVLSRTIISRMYVMMDFDLVIITKDGKIEPRRIIVGRKSNYQPMRISSSQRNDCPYKPDYPEYDSRAESDY